MSCRDVDGVAFIYGSVAISITEFTGVSVIGCLWNRGEFAGDLDLVTIVAGVIDWERKFGDGDVEGAELMTLLEDLVAGEKIDG